MDCFTGVSIEFPRKQKKFPFSSVESFQRHFRKLFVESSIISGVSEFPRVETFQEFPGVGNFLFPKGFHQKWEGKLLTRVQNEPMPEMQSDG